MEPPNRNIGTLLWLTAALAFGLVALSACKNSSGSGTGTEKLYSPQNEELDVYDLITGKMTVLIAGSVDGMAVGTGNVNGQVCQFPDKSGRLLVGEDHMRDLGERDGWSIFSKDGIFQRKIPEPVTAGEAKDIHAFGCAFDAQGRLFVTDIGTGDYNANNGKFIMYFPPEYRSFCLLDLKIGVAGTVAIDQQNNVYVTEGVPPGRVFRFAPPFPTGPAECDPAPSTVKTPLNKSVFVQDPNMLSPIGIVRAPNGNWYVSSVYVPPAINEYDQNGKFVRTIAQGSDIGNPSGIAVDSKGTIYYADLGLVVEKTGELPGPADGKGTVRKITFDKDGKPQPPQIIGQGLSFPDALSVLPPPKF